MAVPVHPSIGGLENSPLQAYNLEKEFDASKEEVFAAEAALKSEKGKHAKKRADIEAEKEHDHKERKKRNSDMAISDLLENF